MDTCFCGHQVEEHRPTKRHPGDTSCKSEWKDEDGDACRCICYEEDPEQPEDAE